MRVVVLSSILHPCSLRVTSDGDSDPLDRTSDNSVTPCLHPGNSSIKSNQHRRGVLRCASAKRDLKNGTRPFFQKRIFVRSSSTHLTRRSVEMHRRRIEPSTPASQDRRLTTGAISVDDSSMRTCVYLIPNYVEIEPLQWGCFFFFSPPAQNRVFYFAQARSLGWHTLKPIRVHLDQNRGSILPLA